MIRFVALLLALCFYGDLHAKIAVSTDVIVYGATPGGFCAAIAAAREGAKVILLEPTDHVGGVNTGGLCFSDSNQTVRSTLLGLFEEWHAGVEADYRKRGVVLPYEVKVKDHSEWTYEPHVAMRITKAMLNEAGVKVLTGARIRSVSKQAARIDKLVTSVGEFEAKVFIDGTYEGDLMAASGVSWTIGREGRDEFGESYAGKQYPKPKIDISGLGSNGQPLPLITTTDAGDDAAGDKNVMVYSFRLCVTKEPNNRVPFPEPDQYDPSRFEVVRRYFAQEKRPGILWDLYKLPGNKFDANNGIAKQFSMGLVGACNGWCEADEKGRAKIWEAHKQYILEMYRFLTTDPAVPERLRKELAEYGLCRDEFPDSGHWSPQLYVREGRRMIGQYILSQRDIIDVPEKIDPIAVSSFPIDSHDCQRVGTATFVLNEGTIRPVRMAGRKHGFLYHVPYRAIIPKAAECNNLLVPVALSCTHVGISSIRVEPTWMVLGQSAGIAAAMCAKQSVAVQALPYPALRERLLAQKQVLELPVLVDPVVPSGVQPDPKDPVKKTQ
jgi:FAD dependent oxidoreductase